MQCKELEAVLESEGLQTLPQEAREHLSGCANCQDLLADLSAIVAVADEIPAEVDPPQRVWVSLRAQLETEGILRDTQPAVLTASPWWQSFAEFFRPRNLAAAGATLAVIFGAVYFSEHRPVTSTAPQLSVAKATAPAPEQAASTIPSVEAPKSVSSPKLAPAPAQSARLSAPPPPRPSSRELLPSPSENAYFGDSAAVLSETEGALPQSSLSNNAAVDASLRQNLRTLNEFIAECETRLKQNPTDELVREYLASAYQQKAELLNAMMDTGRSEH